MKNKTTKLMQVVKQAKLGDAEAQVNLGWMHHEGWEVAQDFALRCMSTLLRHPTE